MTFEYKVIPAPRKGRKARGVKGAEERFSLAIEQVMNDMGADGWEFLRSETLPSDERQGLTSTHTVFRSVLVFRRPRSGDLADFSPELLEDHSQEIPDEPAPEPEETLEALAEEDWADESEADRTRA
jgi:hypothetical protein